MFNFFVLLSRLFFTDEPSVFSRIFAPYSLAVFLCIFLSFSVLDIVYRFSRKGTPFQALSFSPHATPWLLAEGLLFPL